MLVRLKAPAEAASGKQADEMVYFSWRGAQSARSYAIPANPQTSYQTTVRAIFDVLTKRWKTLTSNQRAGWATYAASNQVVNRMGVLVTSTALGMYIRINSLKQFQTDGTSFIDTAPTTASPASITDIDAFVTDTGDVQVVPVHSIGTLTNLKLLAYAQTLASTAVAPKFQGQVMLSGPNSYSFPALPATGTAATYQTPRITPAASTFYGVTCIVYNSSTGTFSLPFTKSIEGTVI